MIISMVRVVVAVLELGPEPALEEVLVVEWVVVEVVLVMASGLEAELELAAAADLVVAGE